MVYVTKEDPKGSVWMDDIEEWSGCSYIQLKDRCHKTGNSGEERQ